MEPSGLSFIPLITFCDGALTLSTARKLRARLAAVRGKSGAAAEVALLRKRLPGRHAQSAVEASSSPRLQMSEDLFALQQALHQAATPRSSGKNA
jgi:hypothetical protein